MKRPEREAILRQGVTLPETPRERRQLSDLAVDLEDNPVAGRPLSLRLRNFRPSAEGYLASLGGPLAYMVRLRQIDRLTGEHEVALDSSRHELARELTGDEASFERRWRAIAAAWSFDDVNVLIEKHNRWFPVESRLPMDPASGDYALVNGSDYRRELLDADWVLERFSPRLNESVPSTRPGMRDRER
jgi:hypothetical protein